MLTIRGRLITPFILGSMSVGLNILIRYSLWIYEFGLRLRYHDRNYSVRVNRGTYLWNEISIKVLVYFFFFFFFFFYSEQALQPVLPAITLREMDASADIDYGTDKVLCLWV